MIATSLDRRGTTRLSINLGAAVVVALAVMAWVLGVPTARAAATPVAGDDAYTTPAGVTRGWPRARVAAQSAVEPRIARYGRRATRYSRHCWVVAAVAAGTCLALAACGSGTAGHGPAASSGASQPTSATTRAVSVPTSASETPTAAPEMRGNAATNPACKLLYIDQVAGISGLAVTGLNGLPGASAYGARSESCTWYLEPKYVQSSLVVQYKVSAQPPTAVAAYYKQVVQQGYAKAVPQLPGVAKTDGRVVDAVYKRAEIHVTLLVHAKVTAADTAATIQLMRLVMKGIAQ